MSYSDKPHTNATDVKSQIADAKEQSQKILAKLEEKSRELATVQSKLRDNEQSNASLLAAADSTHLKLVEVEKENGRLISDAKASKSRIEDLEENLRGTKEMLDELNSESEKTKTKASDIESEIATYKQELNDILSQITDLNSVLLTAKLSSGGRSNHKRQKRSKRRQIHKRQTKSLQRRY